jgi:L-histidine N-alpha-methyltransferase
MARYKILTERDYADSFKEHDAFALDVLVGLSGPRKFIPSKYFYDARGSELFDQITRLPEYYPTGCELEIIEHHLDTISRYVAFGAFNLVELGAGFSTKTTTLLEYFHSRGMDFRFVPIDISESAMKSLTQSIAGRFPSLEVDGLVTDYFNGLKWLNNRHRRKNLVLFLGSSIGNFTHAEACVFMRNVWNCLNHDDVVLIGFDLKKDIELLLRAYNDSRGVTREFNLNVLHRINRELGGTFDVSKFRHFGTYDVFSGGMESYLVSLERQSVFIERIGRAFSFEPWEPIHTEYSYKYLIPDIEQLAGETGFEIYEHLFDERRFFTDSIWRVHKPGLLLKTAGKKKSSVVVGVS